MFTLDPVGWAITARDMLRAIEEGCESDDDPGAAAV
jgi:hypothetical protein